MLSVKYLDEQSCPLLDTVACSNVSKSLLVVLLTGECKMLASGILLGKQLKENVVVVYTIFF